jgi:hypothetical protein
VRLSGLPRPGLVLVPLAITLCLNLAACGDAGRSAHSLSSPSGDSGLNMDSSAAPSPSYVPGRDGYVEGDWDSDDLYHGHTDEDDTYLRSYGHEASDRQKGAVATLLEQYYRAAAAGDGARACSLIYEPIARLTDFADVVPAAYASVSGTSLFRGKTCSQVESVLFELDHKSLAAAATATTMVTSLRVEGVHGIALLAFKTIPERQIAMAREDGRWTVDALLDGEIP